MANRRASRAGQRTQQPHPTSRPTMGKVGRPPTHRRRPGSPRVWLAVAIVVAAVLLVIGGVYGWQQLNGPLPGTPYPSQGNDHINPGETHPPYNSNPPTSGWHAQTPPRRGTYIQPLPEESLVHFMEHAGVVVHYNPNTLPQDQVSRLEALVNGELDKSPGLVILAPDPSIPQPIALTAWQRLATFDTVTGNTGKLKDFIERLQCHYDPEGICGPSHGTRFSASGTPLPNGTMR